MQETTTTRYNPLIDPTMHVWHCEMPLYLFLGGVVAGIMVLTGIWMLRDRRRAPGPEPSSSCPGRLPCYPVGMFFLWLDLENPFNACRFYFTFKLTSPMSWGAWILLGVYPVSILLAWASTPARHRGTGGWPDWRGFPASAGSTRG